MYITCVYTTFRVTPTELIPTFSPSTCPTYTEQGKNRWIHNALSIEKEKAYKINQKTKKKEDVSLFGRLKRYSLYLKNKVRLACPFVHFLG